MYSYSSIGQSDKKGRSCAVRERVEEGESSNSDRRRSECFEDLWELKLL